MSPKMLAMVCMGLMFAAPIVSADKTLYLIRHGDSLWNEAGGLSKFGDLITGKSKFTDAPLSHKGFMDALSLCVEIYGEDNRHKRGPCMAMIEALQAVGTPYVPEFRNALHQPVSKDNELTNAQIMSNARSLASIKHYTSNLVRAIDTLFFAVYPSIVNKRVPNVFSTSYIQEIGRGWDASMRHERQYCLEDAPDTLSPTCANKRHDVQTAEFEDIKGSEAFTRVLRDNGDHANYYKDLVIVPSTNKLYFQFQRFAAGANRAKPAVYTKMFQAFLDLVTTDAAEYSVVAGHSHYFGHMLEHLGADDRCRNFGAAMQHNGAVWRVKLRSVRRDVVEPEHVEAGDDDEAVEPVPPKHDHTIYDCKIIYGRFKTASEITEGYMDEDMVGVLRRQNAFYRHLELDKLEHDLDLLLGSSE